MIVGVAVRNAGQNTTNGPTGTPDLRQSTGRPQPVVPGWPTDAGRVEIERKLDYRMRIRKLYGIRQNCM